MAVTQSGSHVFVSFQLKPGGIDSNLLMLFCYVICKVTVVYVALSFQVIREVRIPLFQGVEALTFEQVMI